MQTKNDLLEQKNSLIAYLLQKVKYSDWHAVQDAASDIREVEAKLEVLVEQDVVLAPAPIAAQIRAADLAWWKQARSVNGPHHPDSANHRQQSASHAE